ncbi:MAG: thioredoxin [Bacteroidales bacterium]|nr:thioredoxin [Bacteroidales bacterium]
MKARYLFITTVCLFTLFIFSCSSPKGEQSNKNIITLTQDNFDSEIQSGVMLVDFWASWCMPCKAMAPVIDEIAGQTKGKIKVGKVDVDAQGELANRYRVQGIPNFLIFKDGQVVENMVGIQSKEALIQALERHIKLQ